MPQDLGISLEDDMRRSIEHNLGKGLKAYRRAKGAKKDYMKAAAIAHLDAVAAAHDCELSGIKIHLYSVHAVCKRNGVGIGFLYDAPPPKPRRPLTSFVPRLRKRMDARTAVQEAARAKTAQKRRAQTKAAETKQARLMQGVNQVTDGECCE